MYYLDNMTEKGDKANDILSYLLDQGLLERPDQDNMIISKRGIMIWRILNHVIEKDKVDVS